MYAYLYAALALVMCLAAAIAWRIRPDLWPGIVPAAVAGGVLEVIAEYWYLQDYWRPETLLSFPAPEDFLYGFGTTAYTLCVAPVLLRRQYTAADLSGKRRFGHLLLAFVSFAVGMKLLQTYAPLPSIWSATVIFAAWGIAACCLRRDVWRPALLAGGFMAVIASVGYGIGLNFFVDGDDFLRQIYLLYGTAWDLRVLGNVPFDEIAWNAARGFGVAAAYVALTGRRLVPR